MTDAAHAVTPSALEAVAREYLAGLGASVRDEGDRWQVSLPTHVDVGFSDDRDFEMLLGDQSGDDGSANSLAPGSEFARALLDEAAELASVGRLALTEERIDGGYRYPAWITESDAEVADASFSPYYDRTGLCAFVRIGVETVSEYQTQFLEAIALDIESETRLPGIAETLVAEFYRPKSEPPRGEDAERENATREDAESGDVSVPSSKLADAIAAAQRAAVEDVRDEIDEIRRSASRSADSEFGEYRKLQEQRIDELRDEIRSLSDRLRDAAADADRADSRQRVATLEKRSELKEQKQGAEAELSEILDEKERGYARKRREIQQRHAIEVNTESVAVTLVRYDEGKSTCDCGRMDDRARTNRLARSARPTRSARA